MTALFQDSQPALQVLKEDRWYNVPPKANHLIINIGDIVQVWSNDRYIAPQHRVLANANHERYSLPYFLNPSYDYAYAPLATPDGAKPRYRSISWGEFRAARSGGDYADQGEEIQISHFRTANVRGK